MNTEPKATERIDLTLEKRLQKILGEIDWLGPIEVFRSPATYGREFDLLVRFTPRTGKTVELWIECKDLPRPSMFPYVPLETSFFEDGAKAPRVPTLAAPIVTKRMAEICKAHNWSWIDLAGNFSISVPGTIYLEKTGRRPVHSRPKPVANLSTDESARILRTLLVPENFEKQWTQRSLQDACAPKVSLGKVNSLVSHLRDQAYIEIKTSGGFQLKDPTALLREWREAYKTTEDRKISCYSILSSREIASRVGELNRYMGNTSVVSSLASFTAAEVIAPHVRQPRTWLYSRPENVTELKKALEAKEVQSGANLMILQASDDGVFFMPSRTEDGTPVTNPLQTYLDLWSGGSRGEEAADAIFNQVLKPGWRSTAAAIFE
ncbi:MAG: hypothetical protein DRQ40_10040 [Gammaproteobacteria bacterium]|nr:MAG: hypothetical protein DRQ40_10040 [Gammaproteobacteria bacterium]